MVVFSAKSVAQYKNVLDTLARRYGGPVDYADTKTVMSILGTKDNGQPVADNTLKSRLTAVVNTLKGKPEHDFYQAEFKKVAEGLKKQDQKADKFVAKDGDFVWADMKKAFEEAQGNEKMILGLYYLQPPRRLDYINMIVTDELEPADKDHNYLVVRPKMMKMIFNTYKTSRTYGQQVFKVGKDLRGILKDHVKVGEYLLVNDNSGKPYTDAQFSQYLSRLTKKLVGKEASATAFRHAFIAHFLKSNPTTDQRKATSLQMGHNVSEQLEYDRREI